MSDNYIYQKFLTFTDTSSVSLEDYKIARKEIYFLPYCTVSKELFDESDLLKRTVKISELDERIDSEEDFYNFSAQRKNMWYEILQCGDGENMDKCLIIANDLTKSYKKPGPKDDFFSPEFYEDIQFFDNPFELVHKYKLKEGKTIAQIICDNNGWDYSILPVYPKDFSPLFGDMKNTDDDEK